MYTILVNWPQKIVIGFFFACTYAPVLYFGIMHNFNNILLGDAAKSLTFIWTVFLLTLTNLAYRIILFFTQNTRFTKFLIRINLEYGKIYTGLWLTACIFIIQAAILNHNNLALDWNTMSAAIIALTMFLFFPAAAAICNYYLTKSFRHFLW